jgi:hypothetical protein
MVPPWVVLLAVGVLALVMITWRPPGTGGRP